MKRAAAVLLMLTGIATVHAAEWVRVSTIDIHQHWYDRSKIYVDGDLVTYWRRVTFRAPQHSKAGMVRSAMYRERVNCRTHQTATLGYLLYTADQAVLENVHTADATAEPVIPETLGDQFEKLMCSLAPQLALEQKTLPATMPRTAGEIRDEIDFLEARLRLLREQLELMPTTAAPDPARTKRATQRREDATEPKSE
jgi:hypothetical protein